MKGYPAKLIFVYNDKRAQMASVGINMAMQLDFEIVKSGTSQLRRMLQGPDASATVAIDSANAWETTSPSQFAIAMSKDNIFDNFKLTGLSSWQ